jgi:predicted nucleotidyltransferase
MKNTYNKPEIIAEILHLFIDCEAIAFTGSYLTDRFHSDSDIDVLLVSSKISAPYSEKIEISGILYEFLFIPLNKIDSILRKDLQSLKGILFNMLSASEIIKDTNGIAANLIEYAKYLHQKHYPYFDAQKRNSLYLKIEHSLRELGSKKHDYLTRFIILNEATLLFSQCYINRHAGFIGDGKNKISALQRFSPKIHDRLQESIRQALSDENNPKPFMALLQSELNLKNTNSEYSQRDLRARISATQTIKLTLPIGATNNGIHAASLQAMKHSELVDFSFSAQSLTLIVRIKPKASYLDIIGEIAKIYHINDNERPRIKLSSAPMGKPEIRLRAQITDVVLTGIMAPQLPEFEFALALLRQLTGHLPQPSKDELLHFLYGYWLADAYDLDMQFDFATLLDIRENTIAQFGRDFKALGHPGNESELNAVLNQINTLYIGYQNDIATENTFLSRLVALSDFKDIRQVIAIEGFFTKICGMLALDPKKAFFAYILIHTNQLKTLAQ